MSLDDRFWKEGSRLLRGRVFTAFVAERTSAREPRLPVTPWIFGPVRRPSRL